MSQAYIGEIRTVGFNFAPSGWATCNGQLLPISEYDTLFSLIGTTYGGDGQTTFGLPDLQSRVPLHFGSSPTGTYVLAQTGGVETVTLSASQMPAHSHSIAAQSGGGTQTSPNAGFFAGSTQPQYGSPAVSTSAPLLAAQGGSQPHSNIQPYLVVNYIISLFGVYPSQS